MKLFSKTLERIFFGKAVEPTPEEKEEEKMLTEWADLIVFNQGEKYEFGECEKCGAEIDPDWEYNNTRLQAGSPYPDCCPKCGRIFEAMVKAEEVK